MAIQNIFVVGAGLMGSGIAQTAITSGYHVVINDQNQAALDRAVAGIEKALARDVEKERLTQEEKDAALKLLSTDSTMEGARNADLVIEAIYENLEAKQAVFKQLEEICPPETIFASNTSSISLTALAAATKRPSRVVGMHFFSPVPRMRLCEVIFGLLELADMIGLDILLNVMNVLSKEYGEKYHPSLLLRKLVTAGFLGRKSGAGFYIYQNGRKMGVNPALTQGHKL